MSAASPTQHAVVLVHGGFVDGSGWDGVYAILKGKGYDVGVVQNATISLSGDVAATQAVIEQAGDPGRPFLWRRGDHRSGQP